ncbi:Glycosyltransferase, catalytic subunit of cellulose synthase and poly-beta-1,6-N-acetylglucosamine synthase [Parasphingorhabdus marina DSM 22363]|uniref:Glycosyltransferase, catalytic subunit of cellulose synthase and poly-beta-1,6-N-acetylglucosamine synthase n=1 Tax=Parasphingorhabdus marina DSM 22363 TaxID=1123272 RepID=A0A1N6CPF5_9SPHN|nr:glycosyltransferase family 2 protein [Parasphingorhabdus marina]SIN60450.1 Glycosyltransferase, catalytic subunit of cellulose synthase and poly-beta-1,6-N-acetylglucosamine synthase [Parasphingorhabdus marina DSM 22363]
MTLVDWGLLAASWGLATIFGLLFAIYSIETFAGLFGGSGPVAKRLSGEPGGRTVILIPAHNEEGIIADTVSELQRRIQDPVSILVVADNCTDKTAELARAAGATVLERQDDDRRGKAYALAHGRDWLKTDPPDCVIVMDADCMLARGSAELLASHALEHGVPAQATNLVEAAGAAPPMVQISNFAMLVKNLLRQRGMTRMGGAALLTGTGMAFPWPLFASAPLASAELAEDLALGVTLTRQGQVPRFVEAARVTSDAAAREDTLVQRTRWEHGFVSTARRYALPLIVSGLAKFSPSRLFLGLHLLVPPLALLFALGIAALLLVILAGLVTGEPLPALVTLVGIAVAATMTLFAWLFHGRDVLAGGALLRVPFYVLWKIPVYLKLLTGRETRWIRTRRAGEEAPDP